MLVSEHNGKQNSNESYPNKYQKSIACSFVHKLRYVDDKLSKPFKTYLTKMHFTVSLIIWSKKINIALKWWKNILTKKF